MLLGYHHSQPLSVDRVDARTYTNIEVTLIIQFQSNIITRFIIVSFLSLFILPFSDSEKSAPSCTYQCKQSQSSSMSQVYCRHHSVQAPSSPLSDFGMPHLATNITPCSLTFFLSSGQLLPRHQSMNKLLSPPAEVFRKETGK